MIKAWDSEYRTQSRSLIIIIKCDNLPIVVWAMLLYACQVCRLFLHCHHRYKNLRVELSSDALTPHTLLCDTSL